MARFLKPLVRSGGYYPSRRWTPLVYPGGYTTANGGEEPAPPPIEKTITGNPIHILDALAKPAQALSVKLEPVQDLHGYDSPWPAGGGKNLFDASKYGTRTTSGVTCTNNGNGSFTLNGTAEVNVYFDIFTSQFDTSLGGTPLPSAQYRLTGCPQGGSRTTYSLYTFPSYSTDIGSGTTFTNQVNGGSIYVASGCTCNNLVFWPMLRLASNGDDTFAPYSNICPISGHTDADVTRTGANLIKALYSGRTDKDVTYTVNEDGTIALSGTASGSSYAAPNLTGDTSKMQLFKAGTYTLSGGLSSAVRLYFGGKYVDGASLSGIGYDTGNGLTYTFPKDFYAYPQVVVASGTDTSGMVIKPMLVLGSTASDFSPYVGATYPIPLGQTVYGGTLDVTTGKLTVDRAYKLLNDADKWITIAGTVTYRYNEEISRKLYDNSYTGLTCTIAPTISNANYTARWQGSTTYYFGIADKATTPVTSLDAIKAMATAGQIAICYAIEPVEIILTPTQIEMLLGENNLWADCGDMTMTYLADGNASEIEALNILLGNRYVNNHGEGEPSDREALDILLGR